MVLIVLFILDIWDELLFFCSSVVLFLGYLWSSWTSMGNHVKRSFTVSIIISYIGGLSIMLSEINLVHSDMHIFGLGSASCQFCSLSIWEDTLWSLTNGLTEEIQLIQITRCYLEDYHKIQGQKIFDNWSTDKFKI